MEWMNISNIFAATCLQLMLKVLRLDNCVHVHKQKGIKVDGEDDDDDSRFVLEGGW